MTGTENRSGPGARRRRIGLVLVAGLLAGLAACVVLDLWTRQQLDAEIARLEGRFGSLADATLNVAPVAPANNRALLVRAAAALTVQGQVEERRALSRFFGQHAESAAPPEVLAFAEANRPAVLLASEIGTRTESRWGRPEDAFGRSADIRTLSDAIYATARLDLEAGRADEAASRIVAGLAVTASFRQESDLAFLLWRFTVATRQLEAAQRLLRQTEPSRPALEELARRLNENRTANLALFVLLAELRQAQAGLTRLEAGEFDQVARRAVPPGFRTLARAGLARPLARLAFVRYLRHLGALIEARAHSGSQPPPSAPGPPGRWAVIDRIGAEFIQGNYWGMETTHWFLGHLGAAELAVALRRFRLDHDTYPDELSALVPGYLDAMPIDPFTSRLPAYERREAGFALRLWPGRGLVAGGPSPEWDVAR